MSRKSRAYVPTEGLHPLFLMFIKYIADPANKASIWHGDGDGTDGTGSIALYVDKEDTPSGQAEIPLLKVESLELDALYLHENKIWGGRDAPWNVTIDGNIIAENIFILLRNAIKYERSRLKKRRQDED